MYLFLEGEVPEGARLTDYVDFTSLPKNVYVVVWGENGKLDRNGFQDTFDYKTGTYPKSFVLENLRAKSHHKLHAMSANELWISLLSPQLSPLV